MSQVSKRSEVVYINGAPSTPSYLLALALLRELSHVPRGLTEIAEAKHVQKNEPKWCFVPVQKKGPKVDPHVSNLKSRLFLFRGVHVHPSVSGSYLLVPLPCFFSGGTFFGGILLFF